MLSIASPALYTVAPEENLTLRLRSFVSAHPSEEKILVSRDGSWEGVSYQEFYDQARQVATMLIHGGIGVNDRVALMGSTSYEWTLIHFGIMFAGAVTVPIYETASQEQVEWILKDSAAKAMIAHTVEYKNMGIKAKDKHGMLHHIWCIEDGSYGMSYDAATNRADEEIEQRCNHLAADSWLALVYTSGTTGVPKGCITTHKQMLAQLENIAPTMTQLLSADEHGPARALLFLPTAHIFGLFALHFFFYHKVEIGHTADIKNLVNEFKAFKPTAILAVPRVFQKIYTAAQQTAFKGGKGRLFHYATRVAGNYSQAMQAGGASLRQKFLFAIFNKLVYSKIVNQLGGRVTWSVCGGAPLGEELGHFYRGIGINIVEGWGLTETCAPITANTEICPKGIRIGSTGHPVPAMEVRIAESGEIEARGDAIFPGYYNNPEADAECRTEDGWFKTGDIGYLDDDGYLHITGRIKDIIVTAGGKNVAPAPMEEQLKTHSLINEVVIVGDQQRFVAALITLNEEVLHNWCNTREKPQLSIVEAKTDSDVLASIQRAIDEVNEKVSNAERIKTFRILEEDFTVEEGTLTPSMKVVRRNVYEKHATELADIYGPNDSI